MLNYFEGIKFHPVSLSHIPQVPLTENPSNIDSLGLVFAAPK